MKKAILFCLLVCMLLLEGCITSQPVKLSNTFDEEQARTMLRPGTNRIIGSAVMRQRGGGTVTCAGTTVTLVPETPYSSERLSMLYGSVDRGYCPMYRQLRFENEDARYRAATRQTKCDAQGAFEFDQVSDGNFYVISMIVWGVRTVEGGSLMQRVTLRGNETKKIVLSPY